MRVSKKSGSATDPLFGGYWWLIMNTIHFNHPHFLGGAFLHSLYGKNAFIFLRVLRRYHKFHFYWHR